MADNSSSKKTEQRNEIEDEHGLEGFLWPEFNPDSLTRLGLDRILGLKKHMIGTKGIAEAPVITALTHTSLFYLDLGPVVGQKLDDFARFLS